MKGIIRLLATVALVGGLLGVALPVQADHDYYNCKNVAGSGVNDEVLVSETVLNHRVEVGLYTYADQRRDSSGTWYECKDNRDVYVECDGCEFETDFGTIRVNHRNTKLFLIPTLP